MGENLKPGKLEDAAIDIWVSWDGPATSFSFISSHSFSSLWDFRYARAFSLKNSKKVRGNGKGSKLSLAEKVENRIKDRDGWTAIGTWDNWFQTILLIPTSALSVSRSPLASLLCVSVPCLCLGEVWDRAVLSGVNGKLDRCATQDLPAKFFSFHFTPLFPHCVSAKTYLVVESKPHT